jgi:hypothetical protein
MIMILYGRLPTFVGETSIPLWAEEAELFRSSSPRSPAKLVSVRYHIGEDSIMPNLLIRDLDDDVLQGLKAAAKANGRSLQAEIHEVLRRANTRNLAETRRLSTKWLKRLSRAGHSDSAALIREDRDAR